MTARPTTARDKTKPIPQSSSVVLVGVEVKGGLVGAVELESSEGQAAGFLGAVQIRS
jgi:hypothetical protein